MRSILVSILAGFLGADAFAQENIDFGVDSHPGAHDGICDDARFRGDGSIGRNINRYETHQDATDCRSLYLAGEIRCKSRRRCAETSRETQFRSLDVRKSLFEDMTNGLAPEDRSMIYVEPQQTRGQMEFASVDGTPVEDVEILLLEPGTHRFQVAWESRPPVLGDARDLDRSRRPRRRITQSNSGFSTEEVVGLSLRNALARSGIQEFEFTLEAGKFYRIHPTELLVEDATLVHSPIIWRRGVEVEVEGGEGAWTLAVWVVNAETGEIVIDQRDDYPLPTKTLTEVDQL